MPFSDIVKYFTVFNVCHFHDNYKYSSVKLQNVRNSNTVFLTLRVNQKDRYYISLTQISKRSYIFDESYTYSSMMLIVYE